MSLVVLPFDVAFLGRTAAARVQQHLERAAPDVVLAGHYEGLAATYGFSRAPVMTLFGDPYHLPPLYRWWYTKEQRSLRLNVKEGLGPVRIYLAQVPRLRRMMRACSVLGATAAHHSKWFSRVAGRPCLYLPSPVEDRAGSDWRERRARMHPNSPPRILAIGHLGQTVTIPGLKLFVRQVLPRLDQEFGPEGFEVHFIGSVTDAPRELLEAAARRSNIRLRGIVDPIDDELLRGDVVLALNPVRLGNRVRIATAFAFGCCVVSHTANRFGMPELRHEENLLLAEHGPQIARELIRALRDPALRQRLGDGGRRTYERDYGDAACAKVEEQLVRMVNGDGARR
jgi:glycosyltransferase involved in cell wall biosynthesis